MRFVILLVLAVFKICSSSIVFRIKSNNKNVFISSSYLFGTIHVAQKLVWPYLSNNTIRILTESNQIWMESDFTDPNVSKYIYRCAIDNMAQKKRARLRAKTWARFLNQTGRTSHNESNKSNILEKWRKWFIDNEFISNKYLWRNQSVTDDIIFDHRIILEAYQRRIYVDSLESIPDDCFQVNNSRHSEEITAVDSYKILSRAYNCDMIDEDFVNVIFKELDFNKMKKRNQQMTKQIRKLLEKDPHQKYVFVVGAAHLFGNISIVHMLQNQYNNDYYIEQVDLPSPNFSYQLCTDEEFEQLAHEIKPDQNKTKTKRFIIDKLFDRTTASLFV